MTLTKKQAELRATILDQLYAKRPISRIDISKVTQITPATTGNIINELIREKIVRELGELQDDSVGRKKTLLDITPRQRFYLGFEISEKYLALVIADNVGQIVESDCFSYQLDSQGGPTDQEIIRLIDSFLEKHQQYGVTALAFGLPGHVQLSQSDYIISKSPHWKKLNLRRIQDHFEHPVYFSNKSHCLTLAERLFGQDSKDGNFSLYHVARGIHCSYMYQGKIYGQDNFLIGEVGHTIIHPDGERCSCGKYGCLQAYASEGALIDKARILYQSSRRSLLQTLVTDSSQIDLKTILTACQLGDQGALELIRTASQYLAISLSNLCQLIDTEKIYLDGEIFSYSLMVEQILDYLHQEEELFPGQKQPQMIIKPFSQLNVARAAISLCVYHDFLEGRQE